MKEHSEWLIPLAGGLVFAIVGIGLDMLFSDDPSYIRGIVGGVAFAVTWIVVTRLQGRSQGDEE